MGLYMVVEGEQTEKRLYSAWLRHVFPRWRQVYRVEDIVPGVFLIVASKGYPEYKQRIRQACSDIRNQLGRINHLFVCVDAEERTLDERLAEIDDVIDVPQGVASHIIVQDCCIETWLLGNRRLVSPNTSDPVLQQYIRHYNVREADPELMPCHPDFHSRSRYHFAYLRQAFRTKGPDSFAYSKRNPGHAADRPYFDALVQRRNDTGHLYSFGRFCDSLRSLGAEL